MDCNKFHLWNDLPSDVKILILRRLPFTTLRHFLFLSRESYFLAKTLKSNAVCVRLTEMDYVQEILDASEFEGTVQLTVISTEKNMHENLEEEDILSLTFVNTEQGCCQVQRKLEREGKTFTLRGVQYVQDPRSAALEILFNLMKMLNVDSLRIVMRKLVPEIEGVLSTHQTIQCKTLGILTEQPALATSLLQCVSPGCELEFYSNSNKMLLDSAFFESTAIRLAPCLTSGVKTEINDDQLILCCAHKIRLSCPNITSKAINQLILDWIGNKRKITNILLEDIRCPSMTEILRGIDTPLVLPWDDLLLSHPGFRTWMKSSDSGIRFALRNNTNQFLLVSLDGNSIVLRDPSYLDSLLY